MAVFEYKALNAQGKQIKGIVDADSLRAARTKLKQQGIFPTSLAETLEQKEKAKAKRFSFGGGKVKSMQLAVATRQLSTLISAGMPIVEALKALSEQTDNQNFRSIISEITDKVNEGSTLAAAMKLYPRVFPRLYVNMISSGEASGSLDIVLERLADLLESQTALQRKVMSALTYPALMVVLCIGVVILLLTVVVPQITSIFNQKGAVLPLPTQIVIALGDVVTKLWWLVLGVLAVAFIGIKKYAATEKGKYKIDKLKLRLPLFGSLLLKVATSRFARNLGSMLQSGIEMLGALDIAKNITGNVVIEELIAKAQEGVREGKSLAKELDKGKLFPRLLIHMIAIGEKTGQLDAMLDRAASAFETEVTATISALTSILEPVLIVFLAGIVGGILASVMLPMLEMTSLTGL